MPLNNFAVRMTYMAQELGPVMREWSRYCMRIALYEHNDDGANSIHCHAHLEDVGVSWKRLKQIADETGVKTTRANGGARATTLFACRGKKYDKDPSGYAYLTKGKYEASYLQGWTKEDTDTWKARWVKTEEHIPRTEIVKLYEKYKPYAPLAPTAEERFEAQKRWVEADTTNQEPPDLLSDFYDKVHKSTWRWLISHHHNTRPPNFGAQLRDLRWTHLWQNSIYTIPKNWKE